MSSDDKGRTLGSTKGRTMPDALPGETVGAYCRRMTGQWPEPGDAAEVIRQARRCGAPAEPAFAKPPPGSRWKHYNGIEYVVMTIANKPDNIRYPETVVYVTADDPSKVWARPLSDWHRSMTYLAG